VVARDYDFFLFALLAPFAQYFFELFFCLLFFFCEGGGFFEILWLGRCFLFVFFSLSRRASAFSKSCALIAASFSRRISSISFSISLTSGGRVMALIRARAPASSMTSIA